MLRPKSAGPGGIEYEKSLYDAAVLRAEICQIANDHHFPAAPQFVDALLAEYTVRPKKQIGRRSGDVDPD